MVESALNRGAVVAIAAGALVGVLTVAAVAYTTANREPSVEKTLEAFGVPFVAPDSEGWAKATQRFNRRVAPVTPRIVVQPTSARQVQQAVVVAAIYGLKVSAKSGGHSYGNYGMGEDGHMVIQLDQMWGVELHGDHTALVRGGSRIGHVATELYLQGNRGISHGSCPRYVLSRPFSKTQD